MHVRLSAATMWSMHPLQPARVILRAYLIPDLRPLGVPFTYLCLPIHSSFEYGPTVNIDDLDIKAHRHTHLVQ